MIAEGTVFPFIVMILLFAFVIVWQWRSRQGQKVPELRVPAPVKVIPQLIGRAVELNRPVHFSSGDTGLHYTFCTAGNNAGWSVLSYVAKTCAELGAELYATVANADKYLIESEAIRAGNVLAGKPNYPVDVQFLSPDPWAYQAKAVSLMKEKQIAVNIMVGFYYIAHLSLGQGAREAGAIGLGGCDGGDIHGIIPTNDYVLLGVENYAAGAILSGDKELMASYVGQDTMVYLLVALAIIGILSATVGSDFASLLKF